MARFSILFVVIVLALFAAELIAPAQSAVVIPWADALARISAVVVSIFDPHVAAYGNVLQSTRNGFAISIEAGCNGIEAAIILVAAMLAFPAPWKHRAIGILAGLAAVQALNIVRVVRLDLVFVTTFELHPLPGRTAVLLVEALVPVALWAACDRTLLERLGTPAANVR